MDDEKRKNGTEATENKTDGDRAKEKDVKKSRRTPSPPSRSDRSRSKSRSRDRAVRRRRSRSRSRGYSPDRRRGGRFRNRGGYFRDNFRRSPDRTRGRNARNSRRSRSQSFDRFRNRRGNRSMSRDHSRSRSVGRQWKKGPMSPLSPSQAEPQPQMPSNATGFGMVAPTYAEPNVYTNFQPQTSMGAYMPNQPFPNYDYSVPMMQNAFTSYPPPNIMQPIPPGDDFQQQQQQQQQQQSQWTSVPPPPIINLPSEQTLTENDEEKQKREAAVALEKKNQRATFRKQRDDYKRRATALKRELKILKGQREELVSGSQPPSPTTNGFLKENDRLQIQIENKIKTMENVIDMLSGIIGDDKSPSPPPVKAPIEPNVDPRKKKIVSPKSDDSSPERLKTKVMESLKKRKVSEHSADEKYSASSERINYTFFDPELHWCKTCEAFPKTAKDFLNHLHSEEHKAKDKVPDTPWHETQKPDDLPSYPNAPTKRTPIRGIQFFVPSTGWFCKLCSVWMGDLHCASSHLKSRTHAQKYTNFIAKNPRFEIEWTDERQRAYDLRPAEEKFSEDVPPPPPIISAKPPPVLDSIPLLPAPELRRLGRNQPPIDSLHSVSESLVPAIDPFRKGVPPFRKNEAPVVVEESSKKGKKKKKEKKKRKKSKKKRQQSSSSNSSSSSDSDSDSSERKVAPAKEAQTYELPPLGDTSNSIRVAMRNALPSKPSVAPVDKPVVEEDENVGGKWTVIQEGNAKPIAPMPPTISANGEAQNRRDELIISQWNAPEPIISEKEKQLLEQLKGRLKKKEETQQQSNQSQMKIKDDTSDSNRSSRYGDRDSKRRRDRSTSRGRYRGRRSRSVSSQRKRSRSPRRDYRRRSRTRSRSRSRSRGRRIEKPIVRVPPEFKPRVSENDKSREKRSTAKSSTTPSSKKSATSTSAAASTKKLPFIGRMPVFKKQATTEEDASKKAETAAADQLSEEQRLQNERRQQELKFQIQQKQQLVQQQQKQAEAFNLAYPGTFANAFNSHGSIHHILPPVVAEEYEELMPDPMQYVTLMGGVPPPPPVAEMRRMEQLHSEPVLPPGIDEEEAEELEPLPVPPPPTKGVLPQDFQDALSIIFDKGVEKSNEVSSEVVVETVSAPAATDVSVPETTSIAMPQQEADTISNFVPMDMDSQSQTEMHIESNEMTVATMELDEQYMLYGSMTDKPLVFNDADNNALTKNIPTPPIQIIDAAGNLTQIPGAVLEIGSNFMVLDANGQAAATATTTTIAEPVAIDAHEARKKRLHELDDLAMLGIDAEDVCI